MIPPPSPPNRRRRRIVVTIAVLVLGVGWWFWPRVDQRFVGRWKTRIAAFSDQGTFVDLVLVLSSDGYVSYIEPDTGRTFGPEKWAVSGSAYRFGSPTSVKEINETIGRLSEIIRISVPTRSVEWRIKSVSEQLIEMTTQSGRPVTLTRVPE